MWHFIKVIVTKTPPPNGTACISFLWGGEKSKQLIPPSVLEQTVLSYLFQYNASDWFIISSSICPRSKTILCISAWERSVRQRIQAVGARHKGDRAGTPQSLYALSSLEEELTVADTNCHPGEAEQNCPFLNKVSFLWFGGGDSFVCCFPPGTPQKERYKCEWLWDPGLIVASLLVWEDGGALRWGMPWGSRVELQHRSSTQPRREVV